MELIYHAAASRGGADHGWLRTRHTFSFAGYYDAERIHFGALRVLNDDIIAGGTGFGKHPHDNMEIISIPIRGALAHADSMGHRQTLEMGEVQVMSAGSGLTHSEMNASEAMPASFLQIWVFPRRRGETPRYEQMHIEQPAGVWNTLVTPDTQQQPGALWIRQDAYISRGRWQQGAQAPYRLQIPGNGVYVFIISGEAVVAGKRLQGRDGLGVWETDELSIEALQDGTDILLLEVPMLA